MIRFATPGDRIEAEKPSVLNQVFMILNTDAIAGQQMMCQRAGDSLSFYTLFASDPEAQRAYDQLIQLGQKASIEGRKVFLTASFPGKEIDKLASQFNSIPKREQEEE
jgi:hypothetical protein